MFDQYLDERTEFVQFWYGAEDINHKDMQCSIAESINNFEINHSDLVEKYGVRKEILNMNSDTIYVNTANKYDKVTIMDILKRYIDINGTTVGFETYVKNDFRDDSGEVEYVKEKKRYKVTIECSSHATVEVEALSEEEAKEIAECSGDRYEFIEGTECEKIIEIEEV